MNLYELALELGLRSATLVTLARSMGMGDVSASSRLSPEQVAALRAAAPAPEVAEQPVLVGPTTPPPAAPGPTRRPTGRSGARMFGFPPFFAVVLVALVAVVGWSVWERQRGPTEADRRIAEIEAMADLPAQSWPALGSTVGAGDGLADFCAVVRRADGRLEDLKVHVDRLDGPAMIAYASAERAGWFADLDAIDALAPADIRPSAVIVTSSVREFVDGVAEAETFEQATAAITGVASSEYVEAGRAWTTFIGQNCLGP